MKRKYGVLGFISFLYSVVGVLVFAGGILLLIGAILSFISPSPYSFVSPGAVLLSNLGVALGIMLSGASLYAFGELIDLLRDLERNARESAVSNRRAAEALEILVHRRSRASQLQGLSTTNRD